MDFQGKTFAITGASSGIGQALAIALAKRGVSLVLGARNQAALQETKVACNEAGGMAIAVSLDVTQPDSCAAFIDAGIQAFGNLHGLVNNAGISMIERFEDVTNLTVFESVMKVNYLGTVYCCHYALPYLKKNQGLLVGISSLCGKTGVPTRSGYVASKHAMQGFLDTLRIELSGTGVDVLIVSPGFVATDIRSRALNGQGSRWGRSNRDETKNTMSLDRCTSLIVRGIEKRQREVIMTPKGKLIPWMKLLAPQILETLARRQTQSSNKT